MAKWDDEYYKRQRKKNMELVEGFAWLVLGAVVIVAVMVVAGVVGNVL